MIGSVGDAKHIGRPKTSQVNENMEAVRESIVHAYKNQLSQQLKLNDHLQRNKFVEWNIKHQQMDVDFSKKKNHLKRIAHFHLDGFEKFRKMYLYRFCSAKM